MKTILAATLSLLAFPAAAQSLVPGPAAPGRYAMQPIEGGVVRLDTVSGEVSLCRIETGTLRCRPAEESESSASPVPPVVAPPAPPAAFDPPARAEEDAEIDRSIDGMKRFLRAFGDIAREFDRGETRPTPAEPSPNRT